MEHKVPILGEYNGSFEIFGIGIFSVGNLQLCVRKL